MNAAVAGLLSAVTYGVGDFLSGLASRRDAPLRIAALTHPPAALALALLALALHQPLPPTADLLWGASAGACGLVAILVFYRALALGPMGAVSVGAGALSAVVPVVVGLLGGETLGVLGYIGGVLVLAGTVLLSAGGHSETGAAETDTDADMTAPAPAAPRRWHENGVILGLLAGVGFGIYFVMLGQAHDTAGTLWTLCAARVCSSLIVVPIAARTVGLRPQNLGLMLASAPGDTLGNFFYLLSVQAGGLALAGLLTSLYPALTTLLAVVVLRERLTSWQWGGVVLALGGAAALSLR